MKKLGLALSVLAALPAALAVGMGDTYEQVVAEKGTPAGKLELGDVMLLNYPGQTIRLEHGKVAVVKNLSSAQKKSSLPAEIAVVPPAVVSKKGPEATSSAEVTWTTDYAAALAQAKAQNRHVFLFFTGSDWCIWCKRLDKEILSTTDFCRYAGENLILVKLDFPKATHLPPELAAENDRLAHQYKVGGFPTVIVLDSSGRAVRRMGYKEGGPAPFISTLAQLP
jgi:thiol-disulfide isomerase/thioredoxin